MSTIADVSNVGPLLSKSGGVAGVVSMSVIFFIYHMANQYTDILNVEMSQDQYAYTGDIIALVLSQLAAAFAAVKAIDAAVQTGSGFYYNYRGGSATGDLIGLYELLAVFSYLTWSLVISIVGYVASALLWDHYEQREKGAADGFLGLAFASTDGYKYIALGCIIGAGAWISSIALGDSSKELIGFFANYNTKTEGYNYDASKRDADGTSIGYDLGYHLVTLAYYYFVSSVIWLGGIIMGFVYMFPTYDGYDCDPADANIARYAPVPGLIAQELDVASCKAAVGQIFAIADVNGDGSISRCENVYFLKAMGNTDDYSLKYASARTKDGLFARICPASRFAK